MPEPIEINANSQELVRGFCGLTPYPQIEIDGEIEAMIAAMKENGFSKEQIQWIFQRVKTRKNA